jgi:UDP-N-acetylmuramate dehydrogenase
MSNSAGKIPLDELRATFSDRLQENVVMANYTTSRVGGVAAAVIMAYSALELEKATRFLWKHNLPFFILGSGSNVLISDAGVEEIIIVNHAHTVKIDVHHEPLSVWAESGANLGGIARQVALRGLSGLEWAASIPGSIGGAVYGNAGAHDGDIKGSIIVAEILHRESGKELWDAPRLDYSYRSSALKRNPGQAVILSARMRLNQSTPAQVKARMEDFSAQRHITQPPGASMGSMFKNPTGDYAGRLIESAGLKGTRIGGAEISAVHANFFVNNNHATASDIYRLILLAQQKVKDKLGVQLELEVELLGNWQDFIADEKSSKKSSLRKLRKG